MSERRTELIRVRLTPSEKAAWEAAAVNLEGGVSELIRKAVEAQFILAGVIKEHTLEYDAELVGISSEQTSPDAVISNIVEPEAAAKLRETFGPKADVMAARPLTDEEIAQFAADTTALKGCPHGTPPWAFCGTCFEAGVTR